MTGAAQITKPGLAAITDLGRLQGPPVGMPVGGALDQYSARAANVLVGQAPDSALVEITALDFGMTMQHAALVAITGAPAQVRVGVGAEEIAVAQWRPLLLPAGARLTVGAIRDGLRVYVAIAGLVGGRALLGSIAPDAAAEFGGRLHRGETVEYADAAGGAAACLSADGPPWEVADLLPPLAASPVVPVADGPDRAQFGASADVLFAGGYTMSHHSNHVGIRLAGDLPRREVTGELISRGVPIGAVEVPPGDELVVLLRGRGITAGYPVLAVATPAGLDMLGQARPGSTIRFVHQDAAAAMADIHTREANLQELARRAATYRAAAGITVGTRLPPNRGADAPEGTDAHALQ